MTQKPAGSETPELEAIRENLRAMTEGLEGMMAAAIRMQILVLEDTRGMVSAFDAMMNDTGNAGTDEGNS